MSPVYRKALHAVPMCLLAVVLAGCTGAPWVDSRREAGVSGARVGTSTLDRIAICHVPDEDADVLQDMATVECRRTGRAALFLRTLHWQCSAATPHRSYYKCSGAGSDPEVRPETSAESDARG